MEGRGDRSSLRVNELIDQEFLREKQQLLDEANARGAQQQSAEASKTHPHVLPRVPVDDQF